MAVLLPPGCGAGKEFSSPRPSGLSRFAVGTATNSSWAPKGGCTREGLEGHLCVGQGVGIGMQMIGSVPEVGRPWGGFPSSSQIASSKSRPSLGLSFLLDQIRGLDEILSQDRFKPQILRVFTVPHIKGGLLEVRKYVSMWEWGGQRNVVTISNFSNIICQEISSHLTQLVRCEVAGIPRA